MRDVIHTHDPATDTVTESVRYHRYPERRWCPYPGCAFEGTEETVDEHRTNAHRDEPQQGSNLMARPRG